MKIAAASDHAGFPMKAIVIEVVKSAEHEVVDLGTNDAARFIGNDPGQERHKHRVQEIRNLESKNFLPE
jgi:ribose 5-phosphate isomerase RpiB